MMRTTRARERASASVMTREVCQRRQDEIAQAVPGDLVLTAEAEVEEGGQRTVRAREREERVADVAWRRDPVRAAQAPRAAAVVGGRDDRGDPVPIGRRAPGRGGWKNDVLQSPQQERDAGPASEGDDL